MHVDRITCELLHIVIRTFNTNRKPPPEVLELALLAQMESRAGKIILLQHIIHDMVDAELRRLRLAVGIPHNEPPPNTISKLKQHLKRDVNNPYNHVDLCWWSALYHKHVAPVTARPEELAPVIGITARTYRRWTKEAIKLLVPIVQQAELEAKRQNN